MISRRPYAFKKKKSAALAALLSVALAAPVIVNASGGVPYGQAEIFSNPTPIRINDQCADPEQPDCAALLEHFNPDLPTTEPDEIQVVAPEVPVVEARPSEIVIVDGTFAEDAVISDISVYIHGIHHDYLNDVDIMLVAPNGAWVMLASNVSSAGAGPDGEVVGVKAEGLNWRFHDSATLPLPRSVRDDGRLSGRQSNPLYNVIYDEWVGVWTDTELRTYKPSDYDRFPDSDHFAESEILPREFESSRNSVPMTAATMYGEVDPSDPSTYKKVINGPRLGKLHGIDPEGVWTLLVADDYYWFDGEIKGGWSLEITTEQKMHD